MKYRLHTPLFWLLILALIVKLGYLFFALPDPSSVAHLSIDALYHYKWASLIASGEFLANAPYFRAPLYPYLLALMLKISGDSLIFVRLIQLLAGCLTLVIAYRLADAIGGKFAAVLAFLLLLFYPITTYFEGELLLDSIFTLFALMSLYLIMTYQADAKPVWAGFFFGLAALTRPTILVFLPVVIFYYWNIRKQRDLKNRLWVPAVFLIIVILTIAPVTAINYLNSGQFILISYQGGVNFYIGNNPEADGLTSKLPPAGQDWTLNDATYLIQQETGRKLTYAGQSFFWYGKGFDYIFSDPIGFSNLLIQKLYFLFSGHEISNNRPLHQAVFENRLLSFLPVRISLIASLAILPLFLAMSDRRKILAIYGIILLYGLTVALFFVNSRFRLPMVPLLAILAGHGTVSLWKTIKSRRINRRLFFGIVSAGFVFVMASSTISKYSFNDEDYALFLKGNQALRRGDYSIAAAKFDTLSRRIPYFKLSNLNLGIAYLKMGESERAEGAFREELRQNHSSAEAFNNLGVIFLLNQKYDSAFHYCKMALEMKPYYLDAAINFLRVSRKISAPSMEDSVESVRQSIRSLIGEHPKYLFEEALYFSEKNRFNEAIDNQLRVVDLVTGRQPSVSFEFSYGADEASDRESILRLAYYQLGYLAGVTGDYMTSIQFSKRAIELDPELKEAYINLISGYRSIGRHEMADSVAGVYFSKWSD